jgi:predicted NACHT family NTPase
VPGQLNEADGEPRRLLNVDGACFDDLGSLEPRLAALTQDERYAYRNANAAAVAATAAERLLVVAGPGAGKTFLFLARIDHWLAQDASRSIYVTTFVR